MLAILALCSATSAAGSHSSQRKCDHQLNDASVYYKAQKSLAPSTCAANTAAYGAANRLTVRTTTSSLKFSSSDTSAAYLKRLTAFRVLHDQWYGRLNRRLQALVPLDKLNTLAAESKVNWIQSPSRPHPVVVSEGVAKTYANTYQTHLPIYDGSSVKVAIIDLGFPGYQAKPGPNFRRPWLHNRFTANARSHRRRAKSTARRARRSRSRYGSRRATLSLEFQYHRTQQRSELLHQQRHQSYFAQRWL